MNHQPLLDTAAALAGIAGELGLDAAARSILVDTRRRLEESQLRVLVIGEIKHGKSSLINAIVGQPVLPTGVTPTTGAIVRIRRGEALEHVLVAADGSRSAVEPTRFAALARGKEKAEGILEVTWSGDQIPPTIELIDTPGVNDINRLRSMISRGELPGADVLILVLDATQALTRTELGFLRDAVVAVGGLGEDSGARLLVALNRIDLVAEHERPLVAAHLRRELHALIPADHLEIFETDSKTALKQPESPSAAVAEVGRLRERIIALAGERDTILPVRARASLRRSAQLLAHNAAIQARALSLEEAALAAELSAVREALSAQELDFERVRALISEARERILKGSRERLGARRSELQAEVLAQLERSDLRAITDVLPASIRDATIGITLAEAELLRADLEALSREALHTFGEQARRRLAQATILLGFRGPMVHLSPPSVVIEGGTLAISVAGTAIMYFGNVVAGLVVTIAGPLATMVLREKAIRDLRAAAHSEIPRALTTSFSDLERTLSGVIDGQIAALEEHLVLANTQLGDQLVAVLSRAAAALQAPPGEGEEPPRHRARAHLQGLERRLAALQEQLAAMTEEPAR
ncbi:MAG: dynamin family protein [Nannocystaceae bacterium]